jgi:hypothetical protein
MVVRLTGKAEVGDAKVVLLNVYAGGSMALHYEDTAHEDFVFLYPEQVKALKEALNTVPNITVGEGD